MIVSYSTELYNQNTQKDPTRNDIGRPAKYLDVSFRFSPWRLSGLAFTKIDFPLRQKPESENNQCPPLFRSIILPTVK